METLQLNPRERRILELLAAGYTQPTAAYMLGITRSTVVHLLQRAMDRNGIHTTIELAVALAREEARAA